MNGTAKTTIMLLVAAALGGVVALKQGRDTTSGVQPSPAVMAARIALPRMVELGSVRCVQCKAMQAVLAELERDYPKTLKVEFIDVWENEDAGRAYNIEVIPTQVFLGKDGKEVFRHQGYFPKEAIVAKWRELGYEL